MSFLILMYVSIYTYAHLMIFTKFDPNKLEFEVVTFTKEVTC